MKKDSSDKKSRKEFSSIRFWIVGGEDEPAPEKKRRVSPHTAHLLPDEERHESGRMRGKRLRAQMQQYHRIYNLAWQVRAAQHGNERWRQEKVKAFAKMLRNELAKCDDAEALLYAVADALTSYPNGLPWEK